MSLWYKDSLAEEKGLGKKIKSILQGSADLSHDRSPTQYPDSEQELSAPIFSTTIAMQERWVPGEVLKPPRLEFEYKW